MAPLPRLAPRLPPARRAESASDPTRRSYVKGALWSLLYVAFSTAIILSNKHIITETNFRCPIAVSSLGSVSAGSCPSPPWEAVSFNSKRG